MLNNKTSVKLKESFKRLFEEMEKEQQREAMIKFCLWMDPNGCYADDDKGRGSDPLTYEEAQRHYLINLNGELVERLDSEDKEFNYIYDNIVRILEEGGTLEYAMHLLSLVDLSDDYNTFYKWFLMTDEEYAKLEKFSSDNYENDESEVNFEYEGMHILDSFVSDCARFDVNPVEYYGKNFINSPFKDVIKP